MKDIKIIYEDENIIILDKPSGITVNNSDTTEGEDTVQDFIENYLKLPKVEKSSKPLDTFSDYDVFVSRAGIVHRIDKETSGILVVAKNLESFKNIQAQFKDREVKKTYIALVHGRVESDEGEIVVPVGRLPWNRKRFGVLAGGKEAVTFYKVIERLNTPYTLLEVNPRTGRTHQIRVHLKYFNHPIFADFLYAGRKTSRDDRKILERVFLHAHKISFFDPVTNKEINFESKLPFELISTIERLKH